MWECIRSKVGVPPPSDLTFARYRQSVDGAEKLAFLGAPSMLEEASFSQERG